MSAERIRVACCDANGVVVDLVVVEDFLAWAAESTATIEARWTGGVFALDDTREASVSPGWTRSAKGAWSAPVTPLAERIESIDEQTSARIAGGFAFCGERMSLSVQSQITISNAYTIRESLPYPLPWGNADNTGFVTMESAKDVEALYQAATMAVLLARTAGNARKKVAMEAAK